MSETIEAQLKRAVVQLYENERLTDALTDQAAARLLRWGSQQLKQLAESKPEPVDLEPAADQLQRLLRAVNRFMETQANLSETEQVEQLLHLLEQAMALANQKRELLSPGGQDGQATEQV